MREQLKRVLIVDADSSVYAIGFMAQSKTHYAKHDGNVVYTNASKREANKWAKEQTAWPVEELEWGYTEELGPVEECLDAVDGWIAKQVEFSGCARYILLLTKGGECFRTKLATISRYKGNRLGTAKPKHYDAIRKHMTEKHDAKTYAKWEADDTACMILDKKSNDTTSQYILAAIDKDLYQMPGMHYNPNKPEEGIYPVEAFDGWYSFYLQMLMGDAADNIKGLSGTKEHPGGGKKKAEALLSDCKTIEELCTAVWQAYQDKWPESFDLIPWWWHPEGDEEEKALSLRDMPVNFPIPESAYITADAAYMFRENANLLYMLRYSKDQYRPHITIPGWEPYPNGTVQHALGD